MTTTATVHDAEPGTQGACVGSSTFASEVALIEHDDTNGGAKRSHAGRVAAVQAAELLTEMYCRHCPIAEKCHAWASGDKWFYGFAAGEIWVKGKPVDLLASEEIA